MKGIILFDLDGTLTDPMEGITKSFRYSLQAFGIEYDSLDGLVKFIGPPIRQSYRTFGFDDAEVEKAVAKYREYFSEKGIYENKLYDGIAEMLKRQREKGRRLALATSKVTVYAERILEHFGIRQYFELVAGSEMDGTRSKKAEVIGCALERMGVDSVDNAIMVGDREHDIIGAKELGMESIGVLYGYGDMAELEKAGADYIAKSVDELSRVLDTIK